MADFDLAVIGAGSAGLSVTYAAARLGLSVALVERDRMGGDCLNAGCVPSKALLAAGRDGASWDVAHARVQAAIAAIAPNDSEARYRDLGATVLRAHARFSSPDALEVDGRRLAARRIVIAAGSRPAVPAIPGLERVPYLTNQTLFEHRPRPEHLLILGGGPLGLEMAQAHAALGCRVTVVEAARIAAKEDEELAAGLRETLTTQGITILEHAKVEEVLPGPTLLLSGGARIEGTHLLLATGRTPNMEGLALDAGGVRSTSQGIATDAGLRSVSNRRVWAAGDIADPAGIGPRYFTHVGSYHAGIIVRRALFRLPARLDYRALPRVTYTDPELAQVGLTAAEARSLGHEVRVLRCPMVENDRAQAERRTDGLAKLVVTSRGRLLGAGILAPHAGEMIGAWGLAITRRLPLSALASQILPYPTRAEAPRRAIAAMLAERLFAPRTRWIIRALKLLP